MKPPTRSLLSVAHSPAAAWASALALLIVAALPASMVTAAMAVDAWFVAPAADRAESQRSEAHAREQKIAVYTYRRGGT
jgi:hypothetical protein